MGGAGSRLEDSGINIRQVVDPENSASRCANVFAKSAGHGHTAGLEVLAEKLITAAAVEAGTAELGVVCNDTFANLESRSLGAESSDNTNDLVAWDEWELRNELAFVNVKIGATNTACLDLDLFSTSWLARYFGAI